tara:strand:- start:1419 stop:2234 length:816 start_codon:yes stop_codon:yes gene_type:complete
MKQKINYPQMKNQFNLLNNLKMKTIQNMALVALCAITIVSCSKNSEDVLNDSTVGIALKADAKVRVGDLPVEILDFVAREYPELTINKAEEEDNGNFEVELSNGTELIFDANGSFLGIDDDSQENGDFDDSEIAKEDLLQVILDYIELNYPGVGIDEAELEHNNQYEVELNNDTILIFNMDGDFQGVGVDENDQDNDGNYDWEDENGNDDGDSIDIAQLPEIALLYLQENYPNLTIVYAEIEGEGDFEVTMSNGLEVYFDAEGNFLSVDED